MNTIRVSCALTLCAALAYGCDSPTPSLPSLPAPPPAPAQPIFHVRIFGVVLDDSEAPVANAEMRGLGGGNQVVVQTFTDATGRYELAGTSPWSGTTIVIKKPRYDDADYFVSLTTGTDTIERNFHLYPSLTVTAGVSIPVWIRADDPSCGFDLEYVCRQVRVRSFDRGNLVLDVTAENTAVQAGLSVGPVPALYKNQSHVSVPVEAGSEVSVYVLRWWNGMLGTQRLTLTTRLQPE